MLNLADCSERIGRIGAALAHFAEALKRLHAGDDRISYTEERIARLKRRVPRLTILAPTDGNTKVSRDQVEVGPGARNVPVAVEPGIHHILVQAPGHRDRQITVVLDEGDERQVRAEPGAAIPPASTPKPRGDTSPGNASMDAASPGGNAGIFPWAIGGAGLASLGVGALAGIIALDKASIVRSACGEGPRCAETGDFQTASDAARTGKEFATISTIGIGVGIAGIATATYLLLRNHGEGQAQGLRRAWSSLALNGTEITTVLVF